MSKENPICPGCNQQFEYKPKRMYCSDKCKCRVFYRKKRLSDLEMAKDEKDIVIDPYFLTRGDVYKNTFTGVTLLSGGA